MSSFYGNNINLGSGEIMQAIADNKGRVFYGTVDPTSTATAFTATIAGITAYDEGLTVILKNGVVTSTTDFTININGLGALPVYTNLAAESRDTGIFNISYTMMFVYENRVSGGDWLCYRGYDGNDVGYQIRTSAQTLSMESVTYQYRLLFTSANKNHFVPANNSSSTSLTEAKEVCSDLIDPWGAIYYYNSTFSVPAGSRPSAASLWEQCTLPLGYSFNTTGQALTLTPNKPVYLQCWPIQNDYAAVIIDQGGHPYVQDLPNHANGAIYIFLGVANSATNIELALNHPVYKFDNGRIRPYVDDSDLITDDDLQLAFDTPNFIATDASSKGVMELVFGFEVQIVVPSYIVDINALIPYIDPRVWFCWLNGTELEFGRMSASIDTSTLATTLYMKGKNSMASGIMGVDDAWTIT